MITFIFLAERNPRARALADCTRLLMPSSSPLLSLESNHRITPARCFLKVFATLITGGRRL